MPFSAAQSTPSFDALSAAYLADETPLVEHLSARIALSKSDEATIRTRATALTQSLVEATQSPNAVDAFLQEYSLSSEEGVLLMRLAESLIRTPDVRTASLLLRDKICAGNWSGHLRAKHALVKLGSLGLATSKAWFLATGGRTASHLLTRLGDTGILAATRSAMALLGHHFVLGTSIKRAVKRAGTLSDYGATYAYDMLGEAALTAADAARYFEAYKRALEHLSASRSSEQPLAASPALSVKLSALHPRFEFAQKDVCVPALRDRLLELSAIAKAGNMGLTIDAEEADRLEVTLLVLDQVLASDETRDWGGLGLAVQAYQRRAMPALDWVHDAARARDRHIQIRLAKGAYWDSEIKRAQVLGLESYPVFTRKEHTDISYLACARRLLDFGERVFPQFATHNAQTAATIAQMAGDRRTLEFQRLHGMSDHLHRRLAKEDGFATRTYAPVGRHKDLLPYLVRRLLENGANSSFVKQVLESDREVEALICDPVETARAHSFSPHPRLPHPCQRSEAERRVAPGTDLTQSTAFEAIQQETEPSAPSSDESPSLETIMAQCATSAWPTTSAFERADILRRAARLFEAARPDLMARCVFEARKTWPDAEAEWREAVDFLTYYAEQAERPTIANRAPLGPVACISPWNFPLAIFIGQVSAALSVGNTVIAKPAEQTPHIAMDAVKLMHEAGIPKDALHLLIGDGAVGAALTAQPDIRGVCFTGSTQTAKAIAKSLAQNGDPDRPLIAETGGINAMIVDSTALLEQAVKDVVRSAFQSAGQRCSACRLVCVQEEVAAPFTEMLRGAMAELRTGDPSRLSNDLGPLIDETARNRVAAHIEGMHSRFEEIARAPEPTDTKGFYLAPRAYEIDAVSDLTDEVFGPVLHLVRFKGHAFRDLLDEIHALGFGLTMGLHSRIDARVDAVSRASKVGNLYINRDQIGAIVGEQPFGGEGLSGTGPKAGGPHYLRRLSQSSTPDMAPPNAAALALPGPTGETNHLKLSPRGRLLCLGGDEAVCLERQLARVRATGNEPVLSNGEPLADQVRRKDIAGIVADGVQRHELAVLLAALDGPILPLLSAEDEAYRFYLERVVTIDTTAAGGNAALLADL